LTLLEENFLLVSGVKALEIFWNLPFSRIWASRTLFVAIAELLMRGDVLYLDHRWYVSHAGLLCLAQRNRCTAIQLHALRQFYNPAVVYRSTGSPSHVSPLVCGAEMRVVEAVGKSGFAFPMLLLYRLLE